MRPTVFVLAAIAATACMAQGAISQARAEPPVIRAEGETRSVACAGGGAEIGGNRNTVAFTGSCTGLQIRGEANTVTVSLASGALIDIEGNRNHVRFTTTGAAPPRLKISGSFTDVAPAPGSRAPSADTAQLAGDDQTVELDCAGHAVTLQGTRSHIRLRGACTALTVRGEANVVQADLAPGASVLVEGNAIALTYTVHGAGPEPVGTVHGMGSSFARADGTAARPASATAPQPPADSVPVLMQALDGIVIEPGTIVKLPKAVFSANELTPAGQTQLGRLASLIAQIHPKGLKLTGRDPDPQNAAAHAASVRAWLEGHGVTALPVEQASETGDPGVDVLMMRAPPRP